MFVAVYDKIVAIGAWEGQGVCQDRTHTQVTFTLGLGITAV